METSKFSKAISPILSSTMTFSSKNTENNSTCAQSLLIEGPTNAQNTDRSLQSPEVPGESTRDNAFTFYSKSNGLPCSKPKQEICYMAEDPFSRYRDIERILKGENSNLKEQNNLMLLQINRLKMSNQKYKNIDRLQKLELQQLREECEAQRRRADELKQIVLNRMALLEEKVKDSCPTDKSSFLQMLEMSQDLNE